MIHETIEYAALFTPETHPMPLAIEQTRETDDKVVIGVLTLVVEHVDGQIIHKRGMYPENTFATSEISDMA